MGSRVNEGLRFVVVHHPASDDVELSLFDHTQPGSLHPPYDLWFDYPSGQLVIGRPLKVDGAHVRPDADHPNGWSRVKQVNNRTSIGVAVEGNFHDDVPPIGPSNQQIEHLAVYVGKVLLPLFGIYPYFRLRALEQGMGIVPHLDVSRTACPGKHFMARWADVEGKIRFYYQQWRNA